jgi:DNA-binding MarR family transcriptional regulator
MKDLSDSLLMSPSGLTRVVAGLERRGAVIRSHCADDGRGVEVELTDSGRSAFRRPARQRSGCCAAGSSITSTTSSFALADIWHAVGVTPVSPRNNNQKERSR